MNQPTREEIEGYLRMYIDDHVLCHRREEVERGLQSMLAQARLEGERVGRHKTFRQVNKVLKHVQSQANPQWSNVMRVMIKNIRRLENGEIDLSTLEQENPGDAE